jgi:predicted Rossmann fold flavoprotein
VVDVLRFALERAAVDVRTGFEVKRIRGQKGGFTVQGPEETVQCDRLIIACGGLAGTKLGGSMSGYQLLRSMGHQVTRLRPALVQLKCQWGGVVSLKGVRANCCASICRDGIVVSQSEGEIQFTEYGLSGPVIFEVSRDACQGSGQWSCLLDFLPQVSADELQVELERRRGAQLTAEDLLVGILHNRLGRVLVKAAGLSAQQPVARLSDGDLEQVCQAVKCFQVTLSEPLGMDSAQVTAGGVVTEEFDRNTMESKLVPGLYACGEVLDVDGDCGGYNLQWAWSSGRLAGFCAGRESND